MAVRWTPAAPGLVARAAAAAKTAADDDAKAVARADLAAGARALAAYTAAGTDLLAARAIEPRGSPGRGALKERAGQYADRASALQAWLATERPGAAPPAWPGGWGGGCRGGGCGGGGGCESGGGGRGGGCGGGVGAVAVVAVGQVVVAGLPLRYAAAADMVGAVAAATARGSPLPSPRVRATNAGRSGGALVEYPREGACPRGSAAPSVTGSLLLRTQDGETRGV
ncbi:hypothetical protein MMPV_004674 [Pyropia vietnamensis]